MLSRGDLMASPASIRAVAWPNFRMALWRQVTGETQPHRHGKKYLDHSNGRRFSLVRVLLGAVMNSPGLPDNQSPAPLDVVALLIDRPELGLSHGAVGTVVAPLDALTSLVEFSDDTGQARAIVPCPHQGLRVVLKVPG
jgi:hypothetical protein